MKTIPITEDVYAGLLKDWADLIQLRATINALICVHKDTIESHTEYDLSILGNDFLTIYPLIKPILERGNNAEARQFTSGGVELPRKTTVN